MLPNSLPNRQEARLPLEAMLQTVSDGCNNCGLCLNHCAFLKRFGTPKEIAGAFDPSNDSPRPSPFLCSLCGLCTAICPHEVDPSALFLEMRTQAVAGGTGPHGAHKRLLAYEARGISRTFTICGLPEGCDTVFFPGCALPGTRPRQTLRLFETLRRHIPRLGVVLDCCTKPSHDLGRIDFFSQAFEALKMSLLSRGIRNILVACPNCYKVFKAYGEPLGLSSIYEILAENEIHIHWAGRKTAAIHDPCAVRFEKPMHAAVRRLARMAGVDLVEMPHHGIRTLCCGEGGAVGNLAPELATGWAVMRKRQAGGTHLITYCAGCAGYLSGVTPTSHILDILWSPEAAFSGKARGAKPPMTYLNRLWLKHRLGREFKHTVSEIRTAMTT